MRLAAAVFAFVATISLASCGSSEQPLPERFTACSTVSRAELAKVLERPVGQPTASSGAATDALAGRSGCAWSSTDEDVAILIELVRTKDIATSVRRTGFSAAARFEAVRHEHPEELAPPIEGASAVFVEEAASLHVLTGSSYLTIEVAATPPSTIRRIAVDLATLAVSRLQRIDGAD